MLIKSIAMAGALASAALPAATYAQSYAPVSVAATAAAQGQDEGSEADGGIFAAPGSGIGIALFVTVIVFGVLTATGTLFDDAHPPTSP